MDETKASAATAAATQIRRGITGGRLALLNADALSDVERGRIDAWIERQELLHGGGVLLGDGAERVSALDDVVLPAWNGGLGRRGGLRGRRPAGCRRRGQDELRPSRRCRRCRTTGGQGPRGCWPPPREA